jgi:hypothetical protein
MSLDVYPPTPTLPHKGGGSMSKGCGIAPPPLMGGGWEGGDWRFRFRDGHAYDVEIVDYHKG